MYKKHIAMILANIVVAILVKIIGGMIFVGSCTKQTSFFTSGEYGLYAEAPQCFIYFML